MLYNCALIFLLCTSGCLLTVSLFSDRWLLVDVMVKQTEKIRVTTYVTVGLWETTRVRYYHYYHHHRHLFPFYHHHHRHHHVVFVYHDHQQQPAGPRQQKPPTPTPPPSAASVTTTTAAAAAAASPKLSSARLTEKTLLHLSSENNGALIAIRVLLFVGVGLTFGALFLLLAHACNDANVIRHRYKERKLAFTMAGLCTVALLLSLISWSAFLGTMYRSVQSHGRGSDTLNSGFVCCILASVCLTLSIVMAACTVHDED